MRQLFRPTIFIFLSAQILSGCTLQRDQDFDILPIIPETSVQQDEVALEILENKEIMKTDVIGQLLVTFAPKIEHSSENTASVTITVPPSFVSLDPMTVDQRAIPYYAPSVVGISGIDQSYIPITQTMRTELSAPAFRPQTSSPSSQSISVQGDGEATTWIWELEPLAGKFGDQTLTLRVFRGDELTPIWLRTYEVEILDSVSQLDTPLTPASSVGSSTISERENTDRSAPFWLTLFVVLCILSLSYSLYFHRFFPLSERLRFISKIIGFILFGIIFIIAMIYIGQQSIAPEWTGFSESKRAANPDEEYEPAKTAWNWMELLIIPAILFSIGAWLNTQIRNSERRIESSRLVENAWKTYVDQMTELLLDKGLRESKPVDEKDRKDKNNDVRDIARTRTLTILRQLDGEHRGMLIQFLNDTDLIKKTACVVDLTGANLYEVNLQKTLLLGIDLKATNLRKANFEGANLYGIDLHGADLQEANLNNANMSSADLRNVNLTGVDLRETNLIDANLTAAILSRARLERADLRGATLVRANLGGANLEGANLSGAYLYGANLAGANLFKATISDRQLSHLQIFRGTIMPDGTRKERI